jgi:hypothetical protein
VISAQAFSAPNRECRSLDEEENLSDPFTAPNMLSDPASRIVAPRQSPPGAMIGPINSLPPLNKHRLGSTLCTASCAGRENCVSHDFCGWPPIRRLLEDILVLKSSCRSCPSSFLPCFFSLLFLILILSPPVWLGTRPFTLDSPSIGHTARITALAGSVAYIF